MNYISDWVGHNLLSFIFLGICVTALFAFALKAVKSKKICGSVCLILLVVIAGGLLPIWLEGGFVARYEMPFLFVPVFAAPIFFTAVFADKWFSKPRFNLIFTGVFVLAVWVIGAPSKEAVNAVINYYPPQQGCLDEQAKRYDLKKGLATYWDPIPEQAFSKSGIQLFTVNQNFQMHAWNENLHRAQGNDFNFILSNENENGYHPYRSKSNSGLLQIEDAAYYIGASHIAEFTCGSFTGYVYSPFSYSDIFRR